MSLTDFSPFAIVSNSFSVIFVIISIFIGLKILFRYFQVNEKTLITVGLTWIFMSSPWWARSISFLTEIFIDKALTPIIYLTLTIVFVPLILLCWIYSYTNLVLLEHKNKINIVVAIFCAINEIIIVILLIIKPELLGVLGGTEEFYQRSRITYSMIFQIISIITLLGTGIHFAYYSLQSLEPKIKWKGRFLLLAFITFTIGSVLEAAIPLNDKSLIIARFILIMSAIEYYFGFFLPKLFLKIIS